MITKESLIEAKESTNEAILKIKQKYSCNPESKRILFVVEGKDDIPYYATKCESFLPDGWRIEIINAYSRKKVVEAHNKLDWSTYNKSRILFFIDRDLSDYTGEETPTDGNCYVTSKYSIENDLCTVETYIKTVKFYYHLEDIDEEDEAALSHFYQSCWSEFEKFSVVLMAKILFWKINKVSSNYSNFKIQNIFTISENSLNLNEEYSDENALLTVFCKQSGLPFRNDNLSSYIAQLKTLHAPFEFIRGKYIIAFFVKLLKYTALHSDTILISKRKAKDMIGVGYEDCIVKLCGIMSIPASLNSFFETMKEKLLS